MKGAGRTGRSRVIGAVILRLDSIPSTNLIASRLAESGCPDGTVVVAKTQTAGRGRRGRTWDSHPGGLTFSVVLRPRLSPRQAQVLTFLGAVASARALRSAGVPVGLKWPNDLVWRGRKMGGILTEAVVSGSTMKYAVTGIGINVSGRDGDFPPGLRGRAVTASQAAGKPVDAGLLFRRVLSNMDRLYKALPRLGGPELLVKKWAALAGGTGQNIALRDGKKRWKGVIRGYGPDGSLIMSVDRSGKKAFHAGEVTVLKKVLQTN